MFCIAIHGGAGSLDASKLTPEQENLYHNGLNAALDAGNAVLRDGGSALDAVQHAVMALEDDPLFNAGKGSVSISTASMRWMRPLCAGKRARRVLWRRSGMCGTPFCLRAKS